MQIIFAVINVSKRVFVRIVSFLIALLVVLSAFLGKLLLKNEEYKDQIKYAYSRSFEILNSSLNNITINLQKATYVTTPLQISDISTEVFSQTVIAKQALSEFPTGEQTFDTVNKFLSQTGNYLVYLSKQVINGGQIKEDEYKNLKSLRGISVKISSAVSSMHNKYNNSGYWNSEIIGEIDKLNNDTLADDFLLIEETLSDYPTLLYDGPYADHRITTKPSLLENAREVTEMEARASLNEMFGDDYLWEFSQVSNGDIPAYEFKYNNAFASVSLDGGYVIAFRKATAEKEVSVEYNQAVGIAGRFLRNKFNKNFIASYYYAENGVCYINFAALQDEVICYADLVKVGIDLSSGDIVFYEASGYIHNHKVRNLEERKYSYSDAKNILSDNLKIISYAVALIPTENSEKLCYEFLCSGEDNEEILLYINAQTLQEEQVFLLLKTDGGTLVK